MDIPPVLALSDEIPFDNEDTKLLRRYRTMRLDQFLTDLFNRAMDEARLEVAVDATEM